jgi:hypothetical protein
MASLADYEQDLDKWLYVELPPSRTFDLSSPIFEDFGNDYFSCLLCNEQQKTNNYIRSHCQSANHVDRMVALVERRKSSQKALEFIRSKYALMEPRIQRLGSSTWRDSMRKEVFPEALSVIMTGKSSAELKWETMEALLCKHEKMEQVSLLELAVWKASCVMDKSEDLTYYAMLAWKSNGWKESKAKMRHSNAIDVIIHNTLPFLS